jgi:RNA polymerase sigma-70 factor (ECF subfamily)
MLGSVLDAEDVVQEAYLRWQRALQAELRSPRAYLSAVVTRLCIDQLRSAKARREEYAGPWLPEPLPTEPAPVLDESLSMAFLVLLESLTPTERAVFLLREVFDYNYGEISDLVDKSEENCRQIARRARQSVAARRPRFESSPEQEERLMGSFLEACFGGDMEGLLALLSEDVTLWSDGGGKTPAALNPIRGADKVVRFLFGIIRKAPPGFVVRRASINGRPGLIGYFEDGRPQSVATFDFPRGASGPFASWSTRRSSGPCRHCALRGGLDHGRIGDPGYRRDRRARATGGGSPARRRPRLQGAQQEW